LEQDRWVAMLAHDRHAVIRHDEEVRQLPPPALVADARDECAQRAIDKSIALELRRVPRVFEMRDAIDAGKDDKKKTPRFGGGVQPGAGNGPVEGGIGAEVMRRGPEHGPPDGDTVATAPEAAGERRADRDALRHEVE